MLEVGGEVAAAIGEQLDDLVWWFMRLACWLRYGHIWYDVGPVEDHLLMVQCRHCRLTLIIDIQTGNIS